MLPGAYKHVGLWSKASISQNKSKRRVTLEVKAVIRKTQQISLEVPAVNVINGTNFYTPELKTGGSSPSPLSGWISIMAARKTESTISIMCSSVRLVLHDPDIHQCWTERGSGRRRKRGPSCDKNRK